MRKQFFEILLAAMAKDDKIIFLTGDLGYGLADPIKEAYPERFYNVGAAEQVLITAGVGYIGRHGNSGPFPKRSCINIRRRKF